MTSATAGGAALLIWGVLGGLLVRPRSGWGAVALIALVTDAGLVVGFAIAETGLPCADDCSNGYAMGLMAIAFLGYIPVLLAAFAGKAFGRRFTSANSQRT
jgi:hypothetical protein